MIRMIAACSNNGVIGLNNSIPFRYSEDMKHFRESTKNSIVIMGRKTFESLDNKPLPNRRNVVISSKKINNIETYSSLAEAINILEKKENIWLIGGAMIYEEGMRFAEQIVLTIVPDFIFNKESVKFPWINPLNFNIKSNVALGNGKLKLITYQKI